MQIFSLGISLDKLCENMGFHLLVFSRIRKESVIMSLYGRENPYSRVFHAVHILHDNINNNLDPYLPHFLQ